MDTTLGVPAALLLFVLFTSIYVLQRDRVRRRVNQQLQNAFGVRDPTADQQSAPNIRARIEPQRGVRRLINLVLRYDPNAPLLWPASRVFMVALLAAVAAMVIANLYLPLWLIPLAGVAVAIGMARGLFGWQRERYADRLIRQLPDSIELIVSAVRAGLPATEAFRAVARDMPNPTREQFERVVTELALGRPPEACLLNLYHRTRVAEYAMFAVTLAVQAKAGGRLAETLQTLGDTIRQRVALAGRAKALSAEAKLSARVLASLPFVSAAVLSYENPAFLNPLLQEQRGQYLLGFSLTSLVLGILTMRRMIKKGTTV